MEHKITHLLHVPFTGLGLYQGYRGNRFLRNRITIFKNFVIPSLQAQSSKNFILWCAFRFEEKNNPLVIELQEYMNGILDFKTVFTFAGICFYDDKYEDKEAKDRLISSIHGSMAELLNVMGEAKEVYMTIQPSDDCYHKNAVQAIQELFTKMPDIQAFGFTKGYICNYTTKEVREYNPTTNPPFYTIKFSREDFIDPFKHCAYTSIKKDVGKYKAGTPIPSHEYVEHALKYGKIDERGFLVGCHFDNVSTGFDNPYAGERIKNDILEDFGLNNVETLIIPFSVRKILFNKLPHRIKRKLRYWSGEKKWILRPIFAIIYNALRS